VIGGSACLRTSEAMGAKTASVPCTSAATRTVLAFFISVFNAGNYTRLDQLFAPTPMFGWYSSNAPGLRRAPAAEKRQTLIAYFRARHQKRDKLRLVTFTFNGTSPAGQ